MQLSMRKRIVTKLSVKEEMVLAMSMAIIRVVGDCPKCDRAMSHEEIRAGWNDDPLDYRTTCPDCGHRFISTLVVEDQRRRTETYWQYLCPDQLFHALDNLLKTNGRKLLGPVFLKKTGEELLWNMIRHFGTYEAALKQFRTYRSG